MIITNLESTSVPGDIIHAGVLEITLIIVMKLLSGSRGDGDVWHAVQITLHCPQVFLDQKMIELVAVNQIFPTLQSIRLEKNQEKMQQSE